MAYRRQSPQPVVEGGTGAQTLTGVLTGNGTSAVTANAVSQYYTLVGDASNAVASIAPSSTAGYAFVSGGSSANPSFSANVVASSVTATSGDLTLNVTGGTNNLNLVPTGIAVNTNITSGLGGQLSIGVTNSPVIVIGGTGTQLTIGGNDAGSSTTIYGGGNGNLIIDTSTNNSNIAVTSGTGEIDISNDAHNTTCKFGTGAGVKLTSIGSTHTSSSTTINSGSAGILTSGVYGVTPAGGTNAVVTVNSASGQLGSTTISSGIVTLNGDSGSATGSTVTITGGTSGAVFTGATATLTQSFNYLSLPTTTSTNGQVLINSVPYLHGYGTNNTFVGGAGNFTLSGANNVGIGAGAMSVLTNGAQGIAIGLNAQHSYASGSGCVNIGWNSLYNATSGDDNITIGYDSGSGILTGAGNIAIGRSSAYGASGALTGTYNVGVGYVALGGSNLTSGSYNIALGHYSGSSMTTSDSHNIYMNTNGTGGVSNVLRIGSGTGTGTKQLNSAYISGINGITVTGTAVLVSASDQLGIAVSSARYKENIADMNDVSSPVLNLRPVTFNYKVGEDHSLQTGLIAEEVQEIMPSLVVLDKEGLPQTVKYHELPVLLLNELQKALKRIEELESKIR